MAERLAVPPVEAKSYPASQYLSRRTDARKTRTVQVDLLRPTPAERLAKKIRWMLVIACLLLIVGGGWLCFMSQVAFIRKERHAVKIKVTAGKADVEKDSLSHVIFGLNGENLSEAKVSLDSSLKAGESGEGEISDLEIPNGRRIVTDK